MYVILITLNLLRQQGWSGILFLKSDASNQYAMCKKGSSDTTIVATSDNRDEWEQFKIN